MGRITFTMEEFELWKGSCVQANESHQHRRTWIRQLVDVWKGPERNHLVTSIQLNLFDSCWLGRNRRGIAKLKCHCAIAETSFMWTTNTRWRHRSGFPDRQFLCVHKKGDCRRFTHCPIARPQSLVEQLSERTQLLHRSEAARSFANSSELCYV
jgi:hypothetical protein